ncbi:MAG: DUF885 family protein [Candidatus Aminicenantes bacterium]|nr:DUF885 family protein [Candidatus Aminicenantes bacterium]
MRKKLILLLCGIGILAGSGWLLSQASGEDAKFIKIVDSYLDEYWKFYPTAGTAVGFAKYADKLEDFSEGAIEKRGTALDGFNKDLVTKVAADKLSPETQVDREILLDAIDFELFRLENLVPQQYNPLFYNEIILNSLRGLLGKGVTDAKLAAATARAKALPGFIKQAKENLKTPPKEYTDAAVKQFAAILDYYKTELPKAIESVNGEAKAKFQAEAAKAVAAVEDWGKFLAGDLLAKSTGNFRLGPEGHTKLLRLTGQNNILVQELIDRSKADINNIKVEMARICVSYYPVMYPAIDLAKLNAGSVEAGQNYVIRGVLDKIKGDHMNRADWVGQVKASAAEIKEFVAKTKLLDVPDVDLTIDAMEPFHQGLTWLKLAGPAPYETAGPFSVQVQPIPADWTDEKANSFLEEFNHYYLPFWTIERIYPGSFFPAAITRKNANILRKLHPSQPLIAGWPLYIEDTFIYAGFGEYDLRLRLNQLKLMLKAVIDFQMELNVHQGNMTKEQVVAYMTKQGFMTPAEAERKWDMIVLNPGLAVYPYMGLQEILDLEKAAKQTQGQAFNKKEFAAKLLSFGPMPLRSLKNKFAQ